jgi:hypothetical protein
VRFLKEVIAPIVQLLVYDVHFHIITCKLCFSSTKTCPRCANLVQMEPGGDTWHRTFLKSSLQFNTATLILPNPGGSHLSGGKEEIRKKFETKATLRFQPETS